MDLLMPQNSVFSNAVGLPPHLPHGTWRSPGHYSALRERITSTEQRVLSAIEVLLKYALNLDWHFKRKDLKPTRSMGVELTTGRIHETHNRGNLTPRPTILQAAPQAKTAASAIGGAAPKAWALCKLILIPSPGKNTYIFSRPYGCRESDCLGEYRPR